MNNKIYSVQIQLTRKCNQRCYMCRKYTWPMKEITFAKLSEIFEKYPDATYTFSGGDPLSYSNIEELNSMIGDYGLVGKYQVLTNCNYRLDEQKLIFLLRAKNVQISFDGWNEETYDCVRHPVENGFKVVCENIAKLLRFGQQVKLNTTLSEKNYKEMHNIIEKFIGWCYSQTISIRVFPVHTHDNMLLNDEMIASIEQQKKKIIDEVGRVFFDKRIFIADMKRDKYVGKCFVKNHHLVVDEDGVEYPCCRAINDNGVDIGTKNSIDNLVGIDNPGVLYDFCSDCDRYRKFNNNWENVEKQAREGGIFL